jgi:hypothetical protein
VIGSDLIFKDSWEIGGKYEYHENTTQNANFVLLQLGIKGNKISYHALAGAMRVSRRTCASRRLPGTAASCSCHLLLRRPHDTVSCDLALDEQVKREVPVGLDESDR